MALIVTQAFGDKKKNKKVAEPKTHEELQIAFGSVFG